MAAAQISLQSQPISIQPVYNPIVYVFSSPLSGNTNFEYQLVIEAQKYNVSGDTLGYETVGTMRQPPNPEGYGIFDIQRYLQNELTSDFDPNNTDIMRVNTDSQLDYKVTAYATYQDDLLWQFNEITQYTSDGELRPSFNRIAPLTANHDFQDYIGYLAVVELDGEVNPTNELFHNQIATIANNGGGGAVFLSENLRWREESETGYTESGTIKLLNKANVVGVAYSQIVREAFNGVFKWADYPDWLTSTDRYDYYPDISYTTVTDIKPYTSMPDNYRVLITDNIWINQWLAIWTGGFRLSIETDNGSFIYAHTASGTHGGNAMSVLAVGPGNLSGTTPDIVVSGSLPVIDDDTTFIKWKISNDGGVNQYSETRTIKIMDPCTVYEKFTFLFQDRWGSFIPVHFYLKSTKNTDISRTNYRQDYGSFNGTSWTYNTHDRGLTNIDTSYNERITVTSDWLTDDLAELYVEMMTSPEVYHQSESGELRAINILKNSVENKKTINDQLINYTVDFEYSNQNKTNI